MARRKRKSTRIAVEDVSPDEDDPIARLEHVARRLVVRDRDAFDQVLAAAETFLAVYERPDESQETLDARLRRIGGTVAN